MVLMRGKEGKAGDPGPQVGRVGVRQDILGRGGYKAGESRGIRSRQERVDRSGVNARHVQ